MLEKRNKSFFPEKNSLVWEHILRNALDCNAGSDRTHRRGNLEARVI